MRYIGLSDRLAGPVLGVVDVEGEGAGDGEGQVGDHGHQVNPGRPVEGLDIESFFKEEINSLFLLKTDCKTECFNKIMYSQEFLESNSRT